MFALVSLFGVLHLLPSALLGTGACSTYGCVSWRTTFVVVLPFKDVLTLCLFFLVPQTTNIAHTNLSRIPGAHA